MNKSTLKSKFFNVLFWSIVPAAFIGPGTVTVCAKAGADYQFALLWSVTFATYACFILQEASARATINSGITIGEAIAKQYEGKVSKYFVLSLVIGAIIFGCTAYEVGNVLGSVEGLAFIWHKVPKFYFVIATGVIGGIALSIKSVKSIANIMGFFVLIMAITFLATAIALKPPIWPIIKYSFLPVFPEASGVGFMILGVIGTTVVPYDLFLGSGILADKKQTIREMRFGLGIAVLIGGLISTIITVAGTAITRDLPPEAIKSLVFNFKLIGNVLVLHLGDWAAYVFGFGMFAASVCTTITAPLASGITARSLFNQKHNKKWAMNGIYFRIMLYSVLSVGLLFGFLQVEPVPVIIFVQALNGIILPFVSIFLFHVINDPKIVGIKHVNSLAMNIQFAIANWVTMIIGLQSVLISIGKFLKINLLAFDYSYLLLALITLIPSVFFFYHVYRKRRNHTEPKF